MKITTITLPRNVHFIYEHALAHLELEEGYGLSLDSNMADPWNVSTTLNGERQLILDRAAYVGDIEGEQSVYAQLVRPSYQGGEFNQTRSENQYLTHWIYPYKGKFHPQMVRAILNILGAEPGWKVADIFSGSGTTVLECQLLGIDALGVEISPLCALLAKVKTQAWRAVDEIEPVVADLASRDVDPATVKASDFAAGEVADFVEIARMVTLSDSSRRRRDPTAYFAKNLTKMLVSVQAMAEAIQRFKIKPGQVDVINGDCRDLEGLGVEPESVDAVITSPPYSLALDYVENDEHALKAMGLDTIEIRQDFIGIRGKGTREKVDLYELDMRKTFKEVARILRPGGKAVFVVGNATIDQVECPITDNIVAWAADAGLSLYKTMPKIVWGLYNLVKDEKILFFSKAH